MKVKIEGIDGGRFYITGDRYNFDLDELQIVAKGENAGKETYKNIGHFTNVSDCMRAILKVKITETEATTLKELIADVTRIEADLKKAIHF